MANRGKRPTRKCTFKTTQNQSKAKTTCSKTKLKGQNSVNANAQNDEMKTVERRKRQRRDITDSDDSLCSGGTQSPKELTNKRKQSSSQEQGPITGSKKVPKKTQRKATGSKNKKQTKAVNKIKLPWEMTSKERYDELTRNDHVSTVPGFEKYPSTRLFGVSWAGSLKEILEDSEDDSNTGTVPLKKRKTGRKTKTARKKSKVKKIPPVSRKSYVQTLLKDHSDVDETCFNRIQDVVFECLHDTMDGNGSKNEFAQGFLESTFLACSVAQRKQLLENKFNNHVTLFTIACEIGNLDAVRFFIDCCNLDVNAIKGEPCLMNAIMKKHYDVVKLLVLSGVDVHRSTDLASNPLVVACGGYPIDFEERGIKREPIIPYQTPQEYDYELYIEFKEKFPGQHGNFEVAELLIEHGALNDIEEYALFNCFKCCIDNKHWNILKLLIANVKDVNSVRDMFEVSVLGYAVEKLEEKAVKMLLKKGANINDTRMLLNYHLSKKRKIDDDDDDDDDDNYSSLDKTAKTLEIDKTGKSGLNMTPSSSINDDRDNLNSPGRSQISDVVENLNELSCRKTRSLTMVKDVSEGHARQTRSLTVIKNTDKTGMTGVETHSHTQKKRHNKQNTKSKKQTDITDSKKDKVGKTSCSATKSQNKSESTCKIEVDVDENQNKPTHLSKNKNTDKEKENSSIDLSEDSEEDGDIFEKKVYVHPIVYVAAKRNHVLLYYFLNIDDIPFHEKMNALEIVGTKVVMSGNSNGAFGAWESALLHRIHYPIKKGEIRHTQVDTEAKNSLFGITEPTTIEELDKHCPNNTVNALIISVLIYERTVGHHPILFLEPLKKLGEYLFNNKMLDGYLDLWSRFLPKMLEVCDDNTLENEECIRILNHLTMILKKRRELTPFKPPFKETMALCQSYINAGSVSGTPESPINGYSEVSFKCYLIALDMLREVEKDDVEVSEFFSLMSDVLLSNPMDSKMQTMLHLAVKLCADLEFSLRQIDLSDNNADVDDILFTEFGHSDMVFVLLYVGFDINAQDINGNTPFHCLFENFSMWSSGVPMMKTIYDLFDEFNAHPDIVNVYGTTPMSRAKKCGMTLTPASWLSLQCKAANVITRENIPYKEHLPPALQKFVALHDRPEKKNGGDDVDDVDPAGYHGYCSIM